MSQTLVFLILKSYQPDVTDLISSYKICIKQTYSQSLKYLRFMCFLLQVHSSIGNQTKNVTLNRLFLRNKAILPLVMTLWCTILLKLSLLLLSFNNKSLNMPCEHIQEYNELSG